MAERHIIAHRSLRIAGSLSGPGDKSIAHRVLILGAMARGTTYARNVPVGGDIVSTMKCLDALGARCDRVGDAVSVRGLGRNRFRSPAMPLDCGGSATALRLLLGAIAGKGGEAVLEGDETLRRRPMARVTVPLTRMGTQISAQGAQAYPPIHLVAPDALEPLSYELDVASAQVKSALILAALCVPRGRSVLTGLIHSRDHTERLIPKMGGALVVTDEAIIIEKSDLNAIAVTIPGDVSTAAFYAAAAALLPNSQLHIRNVCTNPTRMGFFEALTWMGGNVTVEDATDGDREPAGDIIVKAAPLRGIEIHREAIPYLIDEVPLVMLLACFAEGDTLLHGTSELRLKESDRIGCAVEGLTRMGADIEVGEDWVRVHGGKTLTGAQLDPWGDHRMSMMFTVAAHAATGDSRVLNVECEDKSCPGFYERFTELLR
jgi:3-phosphoshikimate 1-carboxyvinyltransferase